MNVTPDKDRCRNVKSSQSGRSPFYAVSVNCLYRDRVRVSGRVTDRVRFRVRVRRPDSSGNLLIRRKMDYARQSHIHSKCNNTEDDEYIVAAEMIDVFHHSTSGGCQRLWHDKFTTVEKISPWMHTIAPTVNELLQLHVGERQRHLRHRHTYTGFKIKKKTATETISTMRCRHNKSHKFVYYTVKKQ